MYARKKELCVRDISLTTNIISQIPSMGMCENKFRIRCSNFKRKGFGRRGRENEFERRRESIETYREVS